MEGFSTRAFLLVFFPFLASCSLNYEQNKAVESSSPQFTLRTASFFRYEDNEVSFTLDSPRIEQYNSPPVTYVEDAVFSSYSEDGTLEAKGRCSLLGIGRSGNMDNSELCFYGAVVMEQPDEEMTLEADALKWNRTSGRVASPASSVTTMTKGGLTLEGKGFAAREKGAEFSFASDVSGFIITDDDEESGEAYR
ncbi:MAG: LPS export ABC transporter periplasmic protein LptC [Treponema sp.]|nr:LPS export ABC transporter periplasmic protein LptC [Treponema sp.]MBQ6566528.1 LPS export ABC transporter periplasmic protein LptC [Treponema sp.]